MSTRRGSPLREYLDTADAQEIIVLWRRSFNRRLAVRLTLTQGQAA